MASDHQSSLARSLVLYDKSTDRMLLSIPLTIEQARNLMTDTAAAECFPGDFELDAVAILETSHAK